MLLPLLPGLSGQRAITCAARRLTPGQSVAPPVGRMEGAQARLRGSRLEKAASSSATLQHSASRPRYLGDGGLELAGSQQRILHALGGVASSTPALENEQGRSSMLPESSSDRPSDVLLAGSTGFGAGEAGMSDGGEALSIREDVDRAEGEQRAAAVVPSSGPSRPGKAIEDVSQSQGLRDSPAGSTSSEKAPAESASGLEPAAGALMAAVDEADEDGVDVSKAAGSAPAAGAGAGAAVSSLASGTGASNVDAADEDGVDANKAAGSAPGTGSSVDAGSSPASGSGASNVDEADEDGVDANKAAGSAPGT
eukprot:366395-Chlamydomonas_euryale.AAC.20